MVFVAFKKSVGFSRRSFLAGIAAGALPALGKRVLGGEKFSSSAPKVASAIEGHALRLVRDGVLAPGVELMRDPASELRKQHLDEIIRRGNVVLVSDGGARKTGFEELVREHLAGRFTEFTGWACALEHGGERHLVIADHRGFSAASVSREASALQEIRSGRNSQAGARVLREFAQKRLEAGAVTPSVHDFFSELLASIDSGSKPGGAGSAVSNSVRRGHAADWFGRTFFSTYSAWAAAPKQLGPHPILIHFHSGAGEPSEHDFREREIPQLVVSNHGESSEGPHARVHFVQGGRVKFFADSPFGEPLQQRQIKFSIKPVAAAGPSSQKGVFSRLEFSSPISVKPERVFFKHEGKWVEAGVSEKGQALSAELPAPLDRKLLGKLGFVVVDSTGFVSGN